MTESEKRAISLKSLYDAGKLSTRTINYLTSRCYRTGIEIKTIGDLIECTERELLKRRNFGQKSLAEVRRILGEMGLSLREEPPPPASAYRQRIWRDAIASDLEEGILYRIANGHSSGPYRTGHFVRLAPDGFVSVFADQSCDAEIWRVRLWESEMQAVTFDRIPPSESEVANAKRIMAEHTSYKNALNRGCLR